MKTTTSNYNAFNEFANSHKVQLSIDVQNLLVEETKSKSLDPAEESIIQWSKLPVQPLPVELMSEWETNIQRLSQSNRIQSDESNLSGTGLRRVITKYRGIKYTQSLPVVQAALNTLLGRLRPIMLDRRQEQNSRRRWFGIRFDYNDASPHSGYAKHLLDNARMRWA